MEYNIQIVTEMKDAEVDILDIKGNYTYNIEESVISYEDEIYKNRIKITKENVVTVEKISIKEGDYSSILTFEKGKCIDGTIQIDSFQLYVDVDTRDINSSLNEEEANIVMNYCIKESEYIVKIFVKKA